MATHHPKQHVEGPLLYTPLDPARLHKDAILPHNPTVRVSRRGHEDDVLLSYYQMPPLDPVASVHVLDKSFETPENRIPFRESLCWPDEEGLLHFGQIINGQVQAHTSEAPARFFDLTDLFYPDSAHTVDDALYLVAELSRPVPTDGSKSEPDIRIVDENGSPIEAKYMVKSSPTEDGHLKVRVYATHAIQGGQSLWAEYRAVGSAGNLMWTREPLRFRSVYTDAALGLEGSTYEIRPYEDHNGYQVFVEQRGSEVSDGTSFLWRVRGILGSRVVWTGWFSDWVCVEDGEKLLAEENLLTILQREHPNATSPVLETVVIQGGELSASTDGSNRPVASTNQSQFNGEVLPGHDLIDLPQQGNVFLSGYGEKDRANVEWRVFVRGKRLEINPDDEFNGRGDGLWEIKAYQKGQLIVSRIVRDWDHTTISTGDKGGLPLYGVWEPPNYFYVTARIRVWVPYRATIRPLVANDDKIKIRVNGQVQYQRGSTRSCSLLGCSYKYYPANLTLQAGWNEIHITVEDRGNNIFTGDRCTLDWDRALHKLLQAEYGETFWIGTGTEPNAVEWTDTLSGVVPLRYGDEPQLIQASSFDWPNFDVTYIDVQATGFPFIDVKKAVDFATSGIFTVQLAGPARQTAGGSKVIPVSLTHSLGARRIASFADILAELNLIHVDEPEHTFVEAATDTATISLRFAYPDGNVFRYSTSPEGDPRISVAELKAHMHDGWLIAWTKIPKRRVAPRMAYRTKDSSRIHVLPMSEHRTPEGPIPSWLLRVRPGRFIRRLPVPFAVNTDRYDSLPILGSLPESQEVVWTYELPEYDKIAFDPAPPFRRLHMGRLEVQSGNRIVLPHPRLAPNPDLQITGVRDVDIAWIDTNTGQVGLRLRPADGDRIVAQYVAIEDALPYFGYPTNVGWMHLDLNANRYHTFSANEDGSIPGHFGSGQTPIEPRKGTELLGKTITVYILPSKAEMVRYETSVETVAHIFTQPEILLAESDRVEIRNGALRLHEESVYGTAYLRPVVTEKAVRKIKLARTDDFVSDMGEIVYEVYDGNAWQPMPKGQYVLFPVPMSEIRLRIRLTDPEFVTHVTHMEYELVGIETKREVLAEWSHTLFHTTLSPEELAADPLAVPLATVYVGSHISPQDIALHDARRRGGGIAAKHLPHVKEEELAGYWDLGFWDGKAHLENGILIVELPATLLTSHGGKLTHNEVMKKLHRHVAFGNMIIVRYRGEDGTWINR